MVREIPLTQGYVALVDDEDYERVMQFKWHARVQPHTVYAGTSDPTDYNKVIYLHRLIIGAPKGTRVDHRHGNGLDCRRSELRLADASQNSANKKAMPNKWGYRGVISRIYGFQAAIEVNGKKRSSRYFKTPREAALEYDRLARHHFGEYACVNFAQDGERAA